MKDGAWAWLKIDGAGSKLVLIKATPRSMGCGSSPFAVNCGRLVVAFNQALLSAYPPKSGDTSDKRGGYWSNERFLDTWHAGSSSGCLTRAVLATLPLTK